MKNQYEKLKYQNFIENSIKPATFIKQLIQMIEMIESNKYPFVSKVVFNILYIHMLILKSLY